MATAAIITAAVPIILEELKVLISSPKAKAILKGGIALSAAIFPKIPGLKFTDQQSSAAMTTAVASSMTGLNAAVIQGTIPELPKVPDEATVQAAVEAIYQAGKSVATSVVTETVEQIALRLLIALYMKSSGQ